MNEQDVPTSEHSPATVVLDPVPADEELDELPPVEEVATPVDPALEELPLPVEEATVVAAAPVEVTAAVDPAGSLLSSPPQASKVAQRRIETRRFTGRLGANLPGYSRPLNLDDWLQDGCGVEAELRLTVARLRGAHTPFLLFTNAAPSKAERKRGGGPPRAASA